MDLSWRYYVKRIYKNMDFYFKYQCIWYNNGTFLFKMRVDKKEEKELRVMLEKDLLDKLEKIKEFHGLKNMTEIIRLLIAKEFRNIQE